MAYADRDWASDPNMHKSTTGYMVKLAGAIFSWNLCAQKTVALSSTKAKYMSLSDTYKQLIWIKSLMTELGINLAPIPLFGDNQSSISWDLILCKKSASSILICATISFMM